MCGIAAILSDSSALDIGRTQEILLCSLRHRGPDANGAWRQRVSGSQELLLVHTRLSILDLSAAGGQPMHDVENGNVIVFNGEVYNFAELRAELRALEPEYQYRSTSDTEVLLRGYAAWGTDVFSKVDGMFALVVFDRLKRRLVIARDHVGIKPLYYTKVRGGGWAFCSEVRSLIATGVAPRRIDPEGLASFLLHGAVSEPGTICAGVRAFPAGSWAELSLEGESALNPVSYWQPESYITGEGNPVDHYSILEATVRQQLVADVPVGIFLSAGADSTALAVLASGLAPGRTRAFTIRSGQGSNDEAELASATAQMLAMPHEVESLAGGRAITWTLDSLVAMDQPSSDGTNTYLVSRASREHGMIAALAGTGADETHGGYGHFTEIPRWRHPLALMIGRFLGGGLLTLTGRGADAERLRLMMDQAPSARAMLYEKRRYFTPSWMNVYAPDGLFLKADGRPRHCDTFPDPRDEIMLGELTGYLRDTLLRDSDWATMANSQELRVPYLGRQYMEYVLSLPWFVKARKGTRGPNKPLIAATIPDSLRSVIMRPKTGFELDFASLLLGPHRDKFLDACTHLGRIGFRFSGSDMIAALGKSHSRKDARRLWALLALGVYLERHNLAL